MKVSEPIVDALNDQIALELNASQHYLGTASWCEAAGYEGAAAYFYAQSDEERLHAIKIVKFLGMVGAQVTIPGTGQPDIKHKTLEDALNIALENERAVSAAIHKMLDLAREKSEYSVYEILEWFAAEQVHEETKFEALLQKFDIIGRDKLAIAEIDRILASQAAPAAPQ